MARRSYQGLGGLNPNAFPKTPVQGAPPSMVSPIVVQGPPPREFTEEQRALYDVVREAIRSVFGSLTINVMTAAYGKWLARTVPVNQAASVWMDQPFMPRRKAILVLNPTVNNLWISESSDVAVNRGMLVPPNNGSIAQPLGSTDSTKVYGIMAAGGAAQNICVSMYYQ